MFTALNKLLDIDNKIYIPKGKFFLISESNNDGSFVTHHFLSLYLKGGHNVCFIALVQSFTHYSSVAQKLGVNLTASTQNGKLIFVEGLKYAVQNMEIESSNEMPPGMQNNPYRGLTSR
ncbi:elongator complex 6 [Paramuricea clavata]|uniref:Elongator complex protein 6 n=1 Tax=Paramuricea clavata TaxID=317549 RepID=A0A6S7JIA4_PARCT|nr:elongator complex 6 [Paramuricea clavata]